MAQEEFKDLLMLYRLLDTSIEVFITGRKNLDNCVQTRNQE